MPIRAKCPGCQKVLAVKDHLAGKRVACPLCKTPLQVPNPSAPPPLSVNKPPVAPPTAAPARSKVPVSKPADLEALAAEALRDQPPAPDPNGAPTNGNGANGHAAADAPIKFKCDYCEADVEVAADQAGLRTPCPECSRIVKVPLPKVQKPKDWRTIEKAGPSLAKANQVEKIEDAWGNETKKAVSQTALLEAGVIEKPKAPPRGTAYWIERGVKGGLAACVVLLLGWGLLTLYLKHQGDLGGKSLGAKMDESWPAVVRAHYKLALAEKALIENEGVIRSLNWFHEAATELDKPDKLAIASANPAPAKKDKNEKANHDTANLADRDLFLVEMARTGVKFGGTDNEQRDSLRIDWTKPKQVNSTVMEEVERTIKKIASPDCKIMALREVSELLNEKKQPEMANSLLRSIISANTPMAVQLEVANKVEDGKLAEANKLVLEGEKNRDFILRVGHAEGHARKNNIEDAMKIAEKAGPMPDKFHAVMAAAVVLALRKNPEAEKACGGAANLMEKMEKESRVNVGVWPLLQYVRMKARTHRDEASKAAEKLPAAFKRRGQLEVALGVIEAKPAEGAAVVRALDDGTNRGLAWIALTRACIRAQLAPPELTDEEAKWKPLVEVVAAAERAAGK